MLESFISAFVPAPFVPAEVRVAMAAQGQRLLDLQKALVEAQARQTELALEQSVTWARAARDTVSTLSTAGLAAQQKAVDAWKGAQA